MAKQLLTKFCTVTAALFVALFVLPQHAKAQNEYLLALGGTLVTSANCNDLTVIDGVKGKVSFNPETSTLTLDNASITTSIERAYAIDSYIDGLNIVLIGNNTITSVNNKAMRNGDDCLLTFKGTGKITINGSTTTAQQEDQCGVINRGTIVISECSVEASGGVDGMTAGHWKFDRCNVRVKGGGGTDEYSGSLGWLWDQIPEFVGCKIVEPAGAYWQEFKDGDYTCYSLFDADKKVITDWVTIAPEATAIDAATAAPATAERGIYTLQGVRLNSKFEQLPAGIYIVNGQKTVKH